MHLQHNLGQELKRKRESQPEPSPSETPRKKPRHESIRRHQRPSRFWDKLSRQHLTRGTLEEFDRRTTPRKLPKHRDCNGLLGKDPVSIKRFARRGGPDMRDVRAYPEPRKRRTRSPSRSQSHSIQQSSSEQSSRKRSRSSYTSTSRESAWKSSAYDPGFEQHLEDHGILMHNRKQKPDNYQKILDTLRQPRPSLSPSRFSDTHFEAFQEKNDQAKTESTVMSRVFPLILADSDIPTEGNLPFKNLAPITDDTISKAQPDHYDGIRPSDLNIKVRNTFSSTIVPSSNTSAPCVPNFFAEGKGPGGHANTAKRQACYDGALGARAMESLRSFTDPDAALDGNAYTISATYGGGAGGGLLTMYATHPAPASKTRDAVEYRMTQLNGWHMTGNINSFREGAAALRNARDWALEQRTRLVSEANSKTQRIDAAGSSMPAFVTQASLDTEEASDTSLDELAREPSILTSTTLIASRHQSKVELCRSRKVQMKY